MDQRGIETPGGHVQVLDSSGAADTAGRVTFFSGWSGSVGYVARKVAGGTQLLSVDEAPVGTTLEHGYRFEGKHLELLSDGSVIIREAPNERPMAFVRRPWATDAMGRALQTRFQSRGDRLFQQVTTPPGTAYPVVADPRIEKRWWGSSVHFNRTETKKIAAGGTVCASVFATAGALIGGPPGVIIAGACGVTAGLAALADADGKCLSATIITLNGLPVPWKRSCEIWQREP